MKTGYKAPVKGNQAHKGIGEEEEGAKSERGIKGLCLGPLCSVSPRAWKEQGSFLHVTSNSIAEVRNQTKATSLGP